jgi:hypothetical protein
MKREGAVFNGIIAAEVMNYGSEGDMVKKGKVKLSL